MSRFFLLESAQRDGRCEARVLGPSDPEAAVRFTNRFRHDAAAALAHFPAVEWYDDDCPRRPVLDLIPAHWFGFFLSERAHEAVGRYAPEMRTELFLDGYKLHWYSPAKLRRQPRAVIDQVAPAESHLRLLMPLGRPLCSAELMRAWQQANLTGAVFNPIA